MSAAREKLRNLTPLSRRFYATLRLAGLLLILYPASPAMSSSETIENAPVGGAGSIFSYTFPICGAPNSAEPGWVPHGDPMINGNITLTISAGLLTLEPSQELLDSTRFVAIHAHLYDLAHRFDNSDIGQSTICWAYYNHTGYGGTCPWNDPDCQALTGVVDWPWSNIPDANWYRDYLETVAAEQGAGWWLMFHTAGGHFATDEEGHLIEWDDSVAMEASFGGKNNKRDACNAHIGRTLGNKDFGAGDDCYRRLNGVLADDYFRDDNGIAWLDSGGNLTADASSHSYDLTTKYLFYNYHDNGQSDRWGGPDGGSGGFITGDTEGRCVNWPPAYYGKPHSH